MSESLFGGVERTGLLRRRPQPASRPVNALRVFTATAVAAVLVGASACQKSEPAPRAAASATSAASAPGTASASTGGAATSSAVTPGSSVPATSPASAPDEKAKSSSPAAANGTSPGAAKTSSSGVLKPASAAVPETVRKLLGRWLRSDGVYTLELRNPELSGVIEAGYFNPKPIHVSRAIWMQGGAGFQVVVELNDVGYPGATYVLSYDPQNDRLAGQYTQPAMQQSFDIEFVRQPK